MGILDALWTSDSKKPAPQQKDQQAKAQPQASSLPISTYTPGTVAPGSTAGTAATGTSTLDVAAIKDAIHDRIAHSDQFAPVLQFLTTAETMKDFLPDEGLRFKAAEKALKLDGASLLDSAKTFTGMLEGEKTNFENQFCASEQSAIESMTAQATDLDTKINDMVAQLTELNAQKQTLQANITTKTADLAKARIDFNSVITTIGSEYTDIAGKIQKHLGVQ